MTEHDIHKQMNGNPFHVIIIAGGLRAEYKLSSEHLCSVWNAAEDARKLDDAKQRLEEAVKEEEK